MDLILAIDIIIILNTAYYDENFDLIRTRKEIAKSYVFSWFIIDLISVLPVNLLTLKSGSQANVAKLMRFNKIYKLIKLVRVARILKLIKERNKI